MKRILLPLLLLAATTSFAGFASDRARFGLDFRLGGIAYDTEDWKDSVGGFGDLGLDLWSADGAIGLWVGCGFQGSTLKWKDSWGPIDTDIFAIPFGASLMARLEFAPGVAIRLEGGWRYVSMDIDDDELDDHYHHGYRRRNSDWDRYHFPDRYLDIDDTSLAVVSAQLEFNLDPVTLGIGGGYQFDLEKPEVTYDDKPIFETDISGAIFFANLTLLF